MKRAPCRCGREDGVALILALLFIVLLTVLVVEFGYETQVEASFAANQGSAFEAYLAAKSAVVQGIALLAQDALADPLQDPSNAEYPEVDTVNTDSAFDIWFRGQAFEPLNEALMRTSISDECGKINLNALLTPSSDGGPMVVRETLKLALIELFVWRNPEVEAEPLVDALIDWLDYDDDDAEEPEGAENDYYSGLENPYTCKNGPMDSIEELLLIKGFTPEFYFGNPKSEIEEEQFPLSEFLTVHGDWRGRINGNTALPLVLAALASAKNGQPIDDNSLGIAREEFDLVHTEQPYAAASEVGAAFGIVDRRRRGRRSGRGQADPANPADGESASEELFAVTSNIFRVYGDGMLGDALVRIEAYVFRTPLDPQVWEGSLPADAAGTPPPIEPLRILDWKVIR